MLFRVTVMACVLGAAPAYAEKRITLEVQKGDVQSVLRVFAELMRMNLVVADDVTGQVTLSLRNVRISDAFNTVLNARGLGYEKSDGNILRVAPLATLAAEAEERAKLSEARLKSKRLETRLIRVDYANAADLVPEVKAMLSPRGTVSVDRRTNTLIVRDVGE